MNNDLVSDVFEGIQLDISQLYVVPTIDSANTGWIGDSFGEVTSLLYQPESQNLFLGIVKLSLLKVIVTPLEWKVLAHLTIVLE